MSKASAKTTPEVVEKESRRKLRVSSRIVGHEHSKRECPERASFFDSLERRPGSHIPWYRIQYLLQCAAYGRGVVSTVAQHVLACWKLRACA